MNKISFPTHLRNSEIEVFSDEPEVPISLDWTHEVANMPGAVGRAIYREGAVLEPFFGIKDAGLVRVMGGLGDVVAVCPSRETAEYITNAGNHFGECRDALADARDLLVLILKGQSSIQEAVDMVNHLETTIADAGGTY